MFSLISLLPLVLAAPALGAPQTSPVVAAISTAPPTATPAAAPGTSPPTATSDQCGPTIPDLTVPDVRLFSE